MTGVASTSEQRARIQAGARGKRAVLAAARARSGEAARTPGASRAGRAIAGRSKTSAATRASAQASDAAESESVSLWFRLLGCHAMMLTELRRELDKRTTLARFDLLATLHRDDGQTLAALSRVLLVTAGNITGLVDRAERDGLVVRRADPSDRRASRVWLTRKGRSLIRELLPAHARQVHQLVGGLPPRDRRELRRLLGGLRDHLAHDFVRVSHPTRAMRGGRP